MNTPYNILDFETTGLSPQNERVIEIGVVKVERGVVINSFQTLINPGRSIPSFITQITGITTRMVQDAPRAPEAFKRLIDFVGTDPIVAHNASFDSRFFLAELSRINHRPSNPFLCTLMLSRRLFPELSSHKLETLCTHLHIKRENAHRALSDVLMTHELLNEICLKLKRLTTRESLEFSELLSLSAIPKTKTQDFIQKLKLPSSGSAQAT